VRTATLLSIALLLGCTDSGSRAPKSPPHPDTRAKSEIQPESDAKPDIVKVPLEHKEHHECTAQGPEQGVLDWSSPRYRRIEVREGKQTIEEKAFLRDSDVVVTVRIGGCAHFGAYYTVSYDDPTAATDMPHHIKRGLKLANGLDFRGDANHRLNSIRRVLEPELDKIKSAESCEFSDGEMTNVSCAVKVEGPGRVSVDLILDIVL